MSKGIRKAKPETVLSHMAQDEAYASEMLKAFGPLIDRLVEQKLNSQSTPEPVAPKTLSRPSKVGKVVKGHKVNRKGSVPAKREPTGVEIIPGCKDGDLWVEKVQTKRGTGTRVYMLTVDVNGEPAPPVEGLREIFHEVAKEEGIALYRFGFSKNSKHLVFPGGPDEEFAGAKTFWWTTQAGFWKIAERWAQARGEGLKMIPTSLDD